MKNGSDAPEMQHLCEPCTRLDFRKLLLHDPASDADDLSEHTPHHNGLGELFECALHEGCELCGLLIMAYVIRKGRRVSRVEIREVADCEEEIMHTFKYWPGLRNVTLLIGPYSTWDGERSVAVPSAGIGLWCVETNYAEPICWNSGENGPLADVRFSLNTFTSRGHSPLTQNVRLRQIPESSESEQCMDLARGWLTNCLQSHDRCKSGSPAESRLPTRIIDVGGAEADPKLVVSEGSIAEYAVLSYCWGDIGDKLWTLTTATLDAFRCGISLSTLPKTLRDAVMITRSLGIKYLWIDALCIIQDSTKDWIQESRVMNDVYGNATVALLATAAKFADDGILATRTPINRHRYLLPYSLLGETGQDSHKRSVAEEPVPVSVEVVDTGAQHKDFRMEDESIYTWETRGWTLQERYLPTRAIYFNDRQMTWSCMKCLEFENGIHFDAESADLISPPGSSYPNENLHRWSLYTRLRDATLEAAGRSDYDERLSWYWYSFMLNYGSRNLSHRSDRLPAIAGLAQTIERALDGRNRYVAGLWENNITEGLLWCAEPFSWHDLSLKPPESWTTDGAVLAPSWSWASVAKSRWSYMRRLEHEDLVRFLGFEVASDEERFIPTSHVVLRIMAPAKQLSHEWFSETSTVPTANSAALEDFLRREVVSIEPLEADRERYMDPEFAVKHRPYPGQRYLLMQVIGVRDDSSNSGYSCMCFLLLESVAENNTWFRRVAMVEVNGNYASRNFENARIVGIAERGEWPLREIHLV